MSHRCELTGRTLQGILREEVAWLCAELTAYHVLIESCVAVDAHSADMCLLSLEDSHLQVDGVAHDVHLCRLQVIEEVSVVPVVVAHGVLIFAESFAEQLLVIHIALLHAEHTVEIVGGEYGVAHPCDVADIVFLSFCDFQIYVHVLGVVFPHAVFQYCGIAVSQLVVFVEQRLLAFLISLRRELGGFQEARQFACLTDLAEGAL